MLQIRPGIPIGYEPKGVALDIGAGTAPIPGFTHVDVRPLPDIEIVVDVLQERLPFADGSVDMVYSSHFLEHVPFRAVRPVLADWCRVLKSGGTIEIHVPDLEVMAKKLISSSIGFEELMLNMYGGQDHPWDYHISGFTRRFLKDFLAGEGLKVQKLKNKIDEFDLVVGAVKE